MAEPFISQITLFGLNFAVRSWAFCNGQLLPISQNSALFSLIGTFYGGDGRTTFALPDLRGRVPVHSGGGSAGPGLPPYNPGARGGVNDVTLTALEMPAHNHVVSSQAKVVGGTGTSDTPVGNFPADVASGYTNSGGLSGFGNAAAGFIENTVGNTGGGQAHENRQPYLALNFEIALQGIFPSRS